jgi:hypothetical protein
VVRGQVLGPDGAPVGDARVVITGAPVPVPDIAAVTDGEVRFSIAVPAAGRYTVEARADAVPNGTAAGSVEVSASPAPESAAAFDADADVGSDEPAPLPSSTPAASASVVLTFRHPT